MDKLTPPLKSGGIPWVSTRFSLSGGEWTGWRGTGRPNPSRETKFSGANEDREKYISCSAGHEQDWQPYPVDLYSAIYDHSYIQSPVLSTCPLHTNSGCGKERRILIGPWWPAKAAFVRNYLEVYWPCAGGLSAMNAIGTQLRDPINSELTRWRVLVLYK